ncbi:MAG: hypothetical protein HDT19_04515 [Oscillibacter sp.]|nr:hypothetical protein [Oscillibacter sp.]
MNTTAKYKLPQWDPDDPIRREDFNSFAANTESALSGLNSSISGLNSSISSLSSSVSNLASSRNAEISIGIHPGVSTTQVQYDFPFLPDFVMILGNNNIKFFYASLSTVLYAAEINGTSVSYNVSLGQNFLRIRGVDSNAVVPYLADPKARYFVLALRQRH